MAAGPGRLPPSLPALCVLGWCPATPPTVPSARGYPDSYSPAYVVHCLQMGRSTRMGLDGPGQMGGRPATVLARHAAPELSPLQSPKYQQGGFGFDTPNNPPQGLRMLHSGGGNVGASAGFMAQLGGGSGGGGGTGGKLLGLPTIGAGHRDKLRRTSGKFAPISNLGSL